MPFHKTLPLPLPHQVTLSGKGNHLGSGKYSAIREGFTIGRESNNIGHDIKIYSLRSRGSLSDFSRGHETRYGLHELEPNGGL